ncbi:MAG TPA: hypothetical protein VJ044_01495, partial [Candidatus Hodarchaeales archaeon]|nr:hypothetical protein [Candidatus Hodarchaeales archaeon]
MKIEGIDGEISGQFTLYKERISGGKSEEIGSSNGFFVNILGRVINPLDPYFGLENLSYSAWSKFRATVRADFLDADISVTREDLKKDKTLSLFQAFLMALFNKVRTHHDALIRAAWPDAGQVLTESWNVVPIDALNTAVTERLGALEPLPEFLLLAEGTDVKSLKKELEKTYRENPGDLIRNVEFEPLSPFEPLVRYDISKKKIIVNSNHPFALENSTTNEEQLIVRDVAISELLSDAYAITEAGIHTQQLEEIRGFRDLVLRLVSQVKRKSGVQIAAMLLDATTHIKGLEQAAGDALEYLGFAVQRMGEPGEPEGVAQAPLAPYPIAQELSEPKHYSFTYDAKSTKGGKVKTSNVGAAGLARHRDKHKANHVLVIAPDYQ